MITTLLIDDDLESIKLLTETSRVYCPSLRICGCALNIPEAEFKIKELAPQLIFLEVGLKDGCCFELLDRLNILSTEIIFITTNQNSMLKAIRHNALDYISKPVDIVELIAAVSRATDKIERRHSDDKVKILLSDFEANARNQRLQLPYKDGCIFVSINEIERLQAKGSYTEIWLCNGESYLVSKNINEYEFLLTQGTFCRVHHSHIININCIKIYHKGRGGYVEMNSGLSIGVSTRKKELFLKNFR